LREINTCENKILFLKISTISENHIINVKLAQVLTVVVVVAAKMNIDCETSLAFRSFKEMKMYAFHNLRH
jgi:hypothetical protein